MKHCIPKWSFPGPKPRLKSLREATWSPCNELQRAKRATQRCMAAPGASEMAKDVDKANFEPAKGRAIRTHPERYPKMFASRCPDISRLDAQMGAKAPIWLDVRTVVAAPTSETGSKHSFARCPNGCHRIEFPMHDSKV